MAVGRVRPTWDPPSESDAGLFTLGVDVVADANQDVAGIWWFQPSAPGEVADVDLSLYVQATQTLVPGTAGTLLSGSIAVGDWTLMTFAAPVTMTGGVTYTIVATMTGEHGYGDPPQPGGYPVDDPTNTVHLPGPGRFQAGAGPYPASDTWSGQHGLDIEMTEGAPVQGTLTIVLPEIDMEIDADAIASATLDMIIPVEVINLDAQATASATLNIEIPNPIIDLTVPGSGGSSVPCSWDIPDPLCCPAWATLSPAQQDAGRQFASLILWAATGRRYGLCSITVRPCSPKPCADGSLQWWGGSWSGSTWVPYIFNGQWFNCACPGVCSCDPRCQVRLPGPVASIVEVTIGGVVVPDTAYRVDDGHWLVRTDGECWPECPDLDTDDGERVFVVTYVRGETVPVQLLTAASTLACEWGKACVGGDCRLSNRVQSLARSGIEIQMVDPNTMLESGMTGLWEVDMVIRALNPLNIPWRLRVVSPDLRNPRTVTSP